MARLAPTRSLATVAMASAVGILLALVVSMPFTHVGGLTVLYTAMIVTGVSMLLRRRVFASAPAPLPVVAAAVSNVPDSRFEWANA